MLHVEFAMVSVVYDVHIVRRDDHVLPRSAVIDVLRYHDRTVGNDGLLIDASWLHRNGVCVETGHAASGRNFQGDSASHPSRLPALTMVLPFILPGAWIGQCRKESVRSQYTMSVAQ
jgi:hypothetical protein